jgi:hypothetical protein
MGALTDQKNSSWYLEPGLPFQVLQSSGLYDFDHVQDERVLVEPGFDDPNQGELLISETAKARIDAYLSDRHELDILLIEYAVFHSFRQSLDAIYSLPENADEKLFGNAVGGHDVDELPVQERSLIFGNLARFSTTGRMVSDML